MMRPDDSVAVVGAGLAGLSCAVALQEAGVPVAVFEAGDGVGGRVPTDQVDGFLLDR
jgi:phytoene dehydrogenase-like protein